MKKTRLLIGLLALSLALATAPAVMAQEEEATLDPATIPEFQRDEALAAYALFRDQLLAAGVSEGDVGAAVDSLEAEYGNLSEKDVEELLAAQMLSDRDGGDDEFGKAEEDELIGGDDEEEEEE